MIAKEIRAMSFYRGFNVEEKECGRKVMEVNGKRI